jgi:predicted PilT family ATPase
MAFGQLVIGPPGSGKTTYCMGMAQFMRSTGRKVTSFPESWSLQAAKAAPLLTQQHL